MQRLVFRFVGAEEKEWVDEKREVVDQRDVKGAVGSNIVRVDVEEVREMNLDHIR